MINSDTFYCESESIKDLYYFIRYESYFQWCSCKDQSTKGLKCKHIFAIEFAKKWGTLKDINEISIANIDQSTLNNMDVAAATVEIRPVELVTKRTVTKSYLKDDYDF